MCTSADKSAEHKLSTIIPEDHQKIQEIVDSCENEQILSENHTYLEMKQKRQKFKHFSLLMIANILHKRRFFHESIFWFEEYFNLITQRKDQLWKSDEFDKLFMLYHDFGNAEMVMKMAKLLNDREKKQGKKFSNYRTEKILQIMGQAGTVVQNG